MILVLVMTEVHETSILYLLILMDMVSYNICSSSSSSCYVVVSSWFILIIHYNFIYLNNHISTSTHHTRHSVSQGDSAAGVSAVVEAVVVFST